MDGINPAKSLVEEVDLTIDDDVDNVETTTATTSKLDNIVQPDEIVSSDTHSIAVPSFEDDKNITIASVAKSKENASALENNSQSVSEILIKCSPYVETNNRQKNNSNKISTSEETKSEQCSELKNNIIISTESVNKSNLLIETKLAVESIISRDADNNSTEIEKNELILNKLTNQQSKNENRTIHNSSQATTAIFKDEFDNVTSEIDPLEIPNQDKTDVEKQTNNLLNDSISAIGQQDEDPLSGDVKSDPIFLNNQDNNIVKKSLNTSDDIVMIITDSEDEDDNNKIANKKEKVIIEKTENEGDKTTIVNPQEEHLKRGDPLADIVAKLEIKNEVTEFNNEVLQTTTENKVDDPKISEQINSEPVTNKKDDVQITIAIEKDKAANDDVIMLDEPNVMSKKLLEKTDENSVTEKDVQNNKAIEDAIQKQNSPTEIVSSPSKKGKNEPISAEELEQSTPLKEIEMLLRDFPEKESILPLSLLTSATIPAVIPAVPSTTPSLVTPAKTSILLSSLPSLSTSTSTKSSILSSITTSSKTDIRKRSKLHESKSHDEKLSKLSVTIKECINCECSKKMGDDFINAPIFVLSHYNVPKKQSRQQFVCVECFDKAVESYSNLATALLNEQPLLLQELPKRTDLVEILDSSDEDDDTPKTDMSNVYAKECLSSDVLWTIEQHFDDVLKETIEKINLDQQLKWTMSILEQKLKTNEEMSDEIDVEIKSLQKMADSMYRKLYKNSNYVIEDLPPLDLNTNKQMQLAGLTYPPFGQLKRLPLDTCSLYYAVRQKMLAAWIPCKMMEPAQQQGSDKKCYRMKFLRTKGMLVKCVSENHIAYGSAPSVRLQVGERVIALFQMETTTGMNKENSRALFFPGVIAEPLQAYNRWRYLVFFDDGYAQYVTPDNVRVIVGVSEKVWEDVHPDSANFIENYLTQYKTQRPMVQVRRGQRMITEWNSKWLYAKVNEIDSSLVQIYFEEAKRTEWIYRGSTRLGPLFQERQKSQQKHSVGSTKRNEPYVEYMTIVDDDDNKIKQNSPIQATKAQKESSPVRGGSGVSTLTNIHSVTPHQQNNQSIQSNEQQQQKQEQQQEDVRRSVAKKSASAPPRPQIQHMNNSTIYVEEDNRPKGKVVYYTAKKHMPPRKFVSHTCNPSCLYEVKHNLSSYSPLAKPLLSGWERQICKSKTKKVVMYRGPCGRRLRTMAELHQYLRLTTCPLNVENFDFDYMIHCLAEYVIDSCIMQNSDISGGEENMVVPCVNYYDNSTPPECIYSAKRIPTDGVNLNLDNEFLCGCDCEDDCLDKLKCQCWQLTIAGAKFGNPNTPPEQIGYEFKRLPEPVPTGIYECNSNCRCSRTCLNRVAQQALQMKLQVFKTGNRGWGLRCLNDVPKGSFICIYAGDLLTEQNANEAGDNFGDEYFAELDYIEVVENLKEGYEPDVVNDDDFDDDEYDLPDHRKAMVGGGISGACSRGRDTDDEFVSKTQIQINKTRYNTRHADAMKRRYSKIYDNITGENNNGTAIMAERKIDDEASDEEEERPTISFVPNPNASTFDKEQNASKYKSIRKFYGKNEFCYIMDAKKTGNIGRYFNHSCSPNLFVQNVFVDTHDLRFPWVAFFALSHIRAGTELTWNYNYDVGSVPGKVLYCQCGSEACRGRLL